MSMIQSDLLLGQEGGAGYVVERSLRFNASDSAYLSRTPSSAGNRKTWTWAGWVKIVKPGQWMQLFLGRGGSPYPYEILQIESSGKLSIAFDDSSFIYSRRTLAIYRDPSAWYHIVVAKDTTQATASNRVKIYVNGLTADTEPTLSGDYPLNHDGTINTANLHTLNYDDPAQTSNFYLADVHFIDGQALTPSSFTEVSATTGQLIPKAYSGSYGTNGFHLDFADNSSAAALGYDAAGSNDWTVNNIQASDGTIYSRNCTLTSPTLLFDGLTTTQATHPGAATRTVMSGVSVAVSSTIRYLTTFNGTNGAVGFTINPSSGSPVGHTITTADQTFSYTGTISELTLGVTTNTFGVYQIWVDGKPLVDGTFGDSLVDTPTNGSQIDTGVGGEVTGNYATLNPLRGGAFGGGLSNGNLDVSAPSSGNDYRPLSTIGVSSGKWYWEVTKTSSASTSTDFIVGIANATSVGGTYAPGSLRDDPAGTIYGVSINFDTLTFAVKKNNVALYSTSIAQDTYFAYVNVFNAGVAVSATVNFGQRPFAYTAPSGFKALCDTNLPAPVVAKPSTVMDVKLYTGNGSTQTISGLGFSPDLVWLKGRTNSGNHGLYDTVRGANQQLVSNDTAAEATNAGVSAFNSDGFNVGPAFSQSSNAWVAWTWDAGSSTVTNTQGSITSQVRTNGYLSIVTYTASGTAGATVGHGLGVAPQFIIVKNRDYAQNWFAYHVSIGGSGGFNFNTTQAAFTSDSGYWNNTNPTSSLITLGNYHGAFGTHRYVAYAFSPVAGYSSFGSYTGNGSADGPFVYTGFRPRFVIQKQISSGTAGQWIMFDSARKTYNSQGPFLFAENSAAEGADAEYLDFLSNGFKFRTTNSTLNGSGVVSIYAAFAESPFQYARAR